MPDVSALPIETEDGAGTGFDLARDEELVQQWRHLRSDGGDNSGPRNAASSGAGAWWLVMHRIVLVREAPTLTAKLVGTLTRGMPVFCADVDGPWVRVDLSRVPPPRPRPLGAPRDDEEMRPWQREPPVMTQAWMMWDGEAKGFGLLLRPVSHLDRLVQYRCTDLELPREAVVWTVAEVDLYLGSTGFVRPGRESALLRSSKRSVRAVRGGAAGLEYRVDEAGSGGVFACCELEPGALVEVCPLHEVEPHLRDVSDLLKRITIRMWQGGGRVAIILGFGALYAASRAPNLHWSFRGEDELVLWANQPILSGRELSVDFSAPPRPIEEASPPPLTWQPPGCSSAGKLRNAGFVLHGNSGIHGRGVFVTKDCAPGELLESCPAHRMDRGAAEAMFNYRWGLANERDDGYFLPLGLGCLYNHSERPNARGSLDVGRDVLEFTSLSALCKGQEVFVSYGDSYFDEDFEGHRRSELLHIEAPEEYGDPRLQRIVELQRALLLAFTAPEFEAELQRRADIRLLAAASDSSEAQQAMEKAASVHALVLSAEAPILERFGYARGSMGMRRMELDLIDAARSARTADAADGPGLRAAKEAVVRNEGLLNRALGRHQVPPKHLLVLRDLDLVFLGAQDRPSEGQVLRVQVPWRAPVGFVRFLLSERYSARFSPSPSHDGDGEVRFLLEDCTGEGVELAILRDTDPLPDAPPAPGVGRLLIAGLAGRDAVWPPGGDSERHPLFTVRDWYADEQAQQRAYDFASSAFQIAGTWSDFRVEEMLWDGSKFVHFMRMSAQGWDSFQILQRSSWSCTLYPDRKDASPWLAHRLLGPDEHGHGMNWTIGRHPEDEAPPGALFVVILAPDAAGRPGAVAWKRLEGPDGEADRGQVQRDIEEAARRRQRLRAEEAERWAAELPELMRQYRGLPGPSPAAAHPSSPPCAGFDFDELDRLEEQRALTQEAKVLDS